MSRTVKIAGPAKLTGNFNVPGDKSISHRVAMIASLASGRSVISGFASSADCHSTLNCLRNLGVGVTETDTGEVEIEGRGLWGWRPPLMPVFLDAGNSGSTIRMLSGLLAAQEFGVTIDGDSSLRSRPMKRIMEPLRRMGASIDARDGNYPPLQIQGRRLKAIRYQTPVASAQVKSCVLLAGLLAEGSTTVVEAVKSRDHTELMLPQFGAMLKSEAEDGNTVTVEGGMELYPINYTVPGDLSSAAFLIAAAMALPDSSVTIRDVGINPTRSAFLDVVSEMGGRVERGPVRHPFGEPIGDISVSGGGHDSGVINMVIGGKLVPNLIDEAPILAVLSTQLNGRLELKDAAELRVKESDRIAAVARGIRALGGHIQEKEDGFIIEGPQRLTGGVVDAEGDHRIAMAFSIAGLIATGETTIVGAESASVSFPEFYDLLASLTPEGTVRYVADNGYSHAV